MGMSMGEDFGTSPMDISMSVDDDRSLVDPSSGWRSGRTSSAMSEVVLRPSCDFRDDAGTNLNCIIYIRVLGSSEYFVW